MGRGGVPRLMCTYALTISTFMFLAAFLSYGVLFYLWKFNLTFIQIRCVGQKRLFSSNENSACRHEITFFTLNHFCEPKLAKTLLVFLKQNLTLYFRVILWKIHVQRSAGNKHTLFFILFNKLFNVDIYRVCFILLSLL